MSKRSKIFCFFLAALILGSIVVLASRSRDPSYGGRTLTAWLKDYSDAALDEGGRRSRCEEAIRAIGAERSTPRLLRMAEAQDGPLRSWIIQKNERWNFRLLKLREADVTQLLGIAGFEALGTNGAAAVPELTRLMQDTNHAFTALRCLVAIGAPAETPICQALTNRSPQIRAFAASQLAWVTDDIEVYLARLERPLTDPDATVRFAAVQALGLQLEYPNEVIPLLVRAMGDSQQSVSGYAAKFLGELGTNGVMAFGALSNVVENGNAYMASHALRSLVSIAPDRALPMTMAWLRSADADRRARAASIMGEFSPLMADNLDALKKASTDSDPKVARSAAGSLRKYREKERQHGGGVVVIDGEPSFGGKGLGEWLKQKPNGDELSGDAQRAIREMGTNAIPGLLARLVYKDEKFGLADDETAVDAVGGLIVLGDRGVPALPRLEELVAGADRRIALYALMAGCNMGTSSVPFVTRALTSPHADVRNQAVGMFIDEPLRSPPGARKSALPAITKLLGDPDENVRMTATNVLKEIDQDAATRAGAK